MAGKLVARIISRPEEDGSPGIIIGACVKTDCDLKSNTVYEITSIDGEFLIKELGESWITKDFNHEKCEPGWSAEIDGLMRIFGGRLLLTKEESENFNLNLDHEKIK